MRDAHMTWKLFIGASLVMLLGAAPAFADSCINTTMETCSGGCKGVFTGQAGTTGTTTTSKTTQPDYSLTGLYDKNTTRGQQTNCITTPYGHKNQAGGGAGTLSYQRTTPSGSDSGS